MRQNSVWLFITIAAVFVSPYAFSAEQTAERTELIVPAYTGYTTPYTGAVWMTKEQGITRWSDPAQTIRWHGKFEEAGELNIQLTLRLKADATRQYKLTVGEATKTLQATGQGLDKEVTIDFGTFDIKEEGFHAITLNGLSEQKEHLGDLSKLTLSGSAIEGAHFNLKHRRNSASVHLGYPVPEDIKITAFYCEVTAVEDPRDTFYMAAGWRQGYLGMQVISPTERRIIFSVWDDAADQHDRSTVDESDQAVLVNKGPDVVTKVFGAEGTGGHSHLKYNWKTGQPQKFLVTAEVVNKKQKRFSGYYFHPDKKEWMLISAWQVANDDGQLIGLHSFCENFWGPTGHHRRHATFGNQWIRDTDGQWTELTKATFTHDATGNDRMDREGGAKGSTFYLATGGFTGKQSKAWTKFERKANGKPPVIE